MVTNPWSSIPNINIGGSGSGTRNSVFNLINQQPDIDKIHLHSKYPHEAKHPFLIRKRKDAGAKHLKLLLNVPVIWMIFITQIKNEKYWSFFMVWLLVCLVTKHLIQ